MLPRLAALSLLLLATACGGPGPSGGAQPDAVVTIPGASGGNGYDDLRYSATLKKVLLGAGGAKLSALVSVDSAEVTTLDGMSNPLSVEEGAGLLFVADRGTNQLLVLHAGTGERLASADLGATPDYVRWLGTKRELWISIPAANRIDVYSVPDNGQPVPAKVASIPTPDAPEGLTLAPALGRAFYHQFGGKLGVVDLEKREVVAGWETGCGRHHGIPTVDETRGFVFAGCSSAKVVVMAAENGAVLGSYATEGGATILGYSPELRHFYLRADPGVPVSILGIPNSGVPMLLGTADATMRGHCMVADDQGGFWVCDEEKGKLLRFKDTFAKTEG